MKNLGGKRALITGAASGIGRGIALALAAEGVDVWLVDIDVDGLASVVAEVESLGRLVATSECDVSHAAEITRVVQSVMATWGGIDILVNNAGVAYYGPTENMSAEQWQWLMSINLLAPIQFTREFLPALLARPEAHLLNVCSISGLVAGGRFAAYHTSKFGLIGFTEALRAEFGRRGLGVTALCPGPVLTKLYKSAISGRAGREVPTPPAWLSSSVDAVSRAAIKSIRRNWRMKLVGPMAHVLWWSKKLAPALLDWLNLFGRKRRVAEKRPSEVTDVRRAA